MKIFKLKKYILLLMLFSEVAVSEGQTIKHSLITNEPLQYKKTEWNVSLVADWKDPYLYTDISLDMVIKTPGGRTLVLPCFYVSGKSGDTSLWKARFAPREVGIYAYKFRYCKNEKPVYEGEEDHFTVAASGSKGFLKKNNEWSFVFDNGVAFRGIGENIGWEARSNDDSKYFKKLHENPRFNYEYMLRKLSACGGSFYRTWMCAWNLPLEWKKVINTSRYRDSDDHFNPSMFEKMDRLVELSDSLNVYMMLCLDGAVGLTNSGWDINNYNKLNGGYAETPSGFFSDSLSKIQYKSRLRYLVARWGYSTSIGAWEFFNEIDNAIYDGKYKIDPALAVHWHDEMSTYLKSIDPYQHLVTTSISHRDIEGLNTLPCIDFNQKHIYVNVESIAGTISSYLSKYNKPYVIGEFGNQWDWSLDFNQYAEAFDYDFKRGLWYGLFSPTPILPMTWWWEFFDERNMTQYYSRVRKISDEMIDAGNGDFQKVNVSVNQTGQQVYGLKCGKKTFIYILNNTDLPVINDLAVEDSIKNIGKAYFYLPESDSYMQAGGVIGKTNTGMNITGIKLERKQDEVIIIDAF